jgi:hypothetical protein
MDPTRDRNLIWLASGSAARRAGKTNLATAWDVAVAQMAVAEQAGDRAGAARWEAEADALFAQITGRQPNGDLTSHGASWRRSSVTSKQAAPGLCGERLLRCVWWGRSSVGEEESVHRRANLGVAEDGHSPLTGDPPGAEHWTGTRGADDEAGVSGRSPRVVVGAAGSQ